MSSTSDYIELLNEIQAIAPENVSTLNMPVGIFVQEAEDLYHWSATDQNALISAGISAEMITNLPVRTGACREAQSLWMKERNTRQEAEQGWIIMAPKAFGLRDQLLHSFRYAFRKDQGLMGRVDEIALGDTNSDMVQDLNDLSVLGKAHLDLVTVIGVTPQLLDNAANMADQIGNLLGVTNGERDTVSEAMIIRDKAFTFLKETVDELRNCGKYVFWRNPDRLKGYNSEYWKQHHSTPEAAPVIATSQT